MDEKRTIAALSSDVLARSISRRTMLARTALFGITAPVAFSLLAACGGDDDDDDMRPASSEEEPISGSGPFPAVQTDYVYLLMPVRLPG